MNIKVTLKTVWGKQLIYPACEKSTILTKLLDRQTLTLHDIDKLKQLGFTIEVINNEPKTL